MLLRCVRLSDSIKVSSLCMAKRLIKKELATPESEVGRPVYGFVDYELCCWGSERGREGDAIRNGNNA